MEGRGVGDMVLAFCVVCIDGAVIHIPITGEESCNQNKEENQLLELISSAHDTFSTFRPYLSTVDGLGTSMIMDSLTSTI